MYGNAAVQRIDLSRYADRGGNMNTNDILAAIDQHITQLQQARALLAGNESMGAPTGKRTMSPEGRARIAAAQKARWAAKRTPAKFSEAAAKKSSAKPKAAKKHTPPKKEAATAEA